MNWKSMSKFLSQEDVEEILSSPEIFYEKIFVGIELSEEMKSRFIHGDMEKALYSLTPGILTSSSVNELKRLQRHYEVVESLEYHKNTY